MQTGGTEMKSIFLAIISSAILTLVGWKAVERPQQAVTPGATVEHSILGGQELQGAWYAFPAGLAIEFNHDGSGLFGSVSGNDAGGISFDSRFEGDHLQIWFAEYQGESEECQTTTGVYTVESLEAGNIRFSPVQDHCQFRLDALNGQADLGFELTFHPLD
jgi:hypothetical protein